MLVGGPRLRAVVFNPVLSSGKMVVKILTRRTVYYVLFLYNFDFH